MEGIFIFVMLCAGVAGGVVFIFAKALQWFSWRSNKKGVLAAVSLSRGMASGFFLAVLSFVVFPIAFAGTSFYLPIVAFVAGMVGSMWLEIKAKKKTGGLIALALSFLAGALLFLSVPQAELICIAVVFYAGFRETYFYKHSFLWHPLFTVVGIGAGVYSAYWQEIACGGAITFFGGVLLFDVCAQMLPEKREGAFTCAGALAGFILGILICCTF